MMLGTPFGSSQSHAVPRDMRTYQHVTGIEFIELDPNLPYPRSAAYRQVPEGAQMRIRKAAPELFEVELTNSEASDLVTALDEAGLFDWRRIYTPVQGDFVNVATQWRIQVDFDQPIAKRTKSFMSEGEDEHPDSFEQVVRILLGYADGKCDG